ncbi:MAG TPA: hypothetical protein VHY37_06125 [Tepidisphaeraceae bacterium]|nr:hypothetical protein [Tepidisphaeraceae bacterium]
MLIDSGPLLSLVDRRQSMHGPCTDFLRGAPLPLVSTWPCLTEAMYLAGKAGGYNAQGLIWEYLEKGVIKLHQHDEDDTLMMSKLMYQYRNVPMDLADASLVAAAQSGGSDRFSPWTTIFGFTTSLTEGC